MKPVPCIPESAPFTAEQRAWLNGFLAGWLGHSESPKPAPAPDPAADATPLLILYGSQSGTAESLAKQIHKQASSKGFASRVRGMDEIDAARLSEQRNVLMITSTWGEGEMPDNAASFWEALNQNGASPELEGVNYSVLALGDTNYGETFCLAGKMLDRRLEELGARRVHPRIDCDVDYDEPAQQWSESVFRALLGENAAAPALSTNDVQPAPAAPAHSKKNPFPAPLLVNRRLTAGASEKDTRHIVFSLAGSGLTYEAGDALGVFARNCPEVVDAVIAAHRLDPSAEVPSPSGDLVTLREALIHHHEIRSLLGATINAPAASENFVSGLRKLQPRLYSIASSPRVHPGEVHLCVDVVRYEVDGLRHKGVASTFLAERLALTETADVFVQTTKGFRPPADPDTPMIMVGPGTGIAPFRAFLEERQAIGATGHNWLFFGARHRDTDFLYSEQLTAWLADGHLARLDLAFSRDQREKLYVQHLLEREATAVWAWLEEGARFYVCGDAKHMAKDVDRALHAVIETAGGKTAEEAAAYVADLRESKRYCRDVY